MNTTISSNSTECIQDPIVTAVVTPCLYSIIFLVSLVLNSLAARVIFNIPTASTFVVYLKNVVLADILMTLTIPVKILNDVGVGSWRLRVIYCRYSAILFYLSVYISVFFLGLISLDRYLKIVRPYGKYALQKVRVGRGLSATVWVVMLSLALANIILSNKPPQLSGVVWCMSLKSEFGLILYEGSKYVCQVVFWGTLALMVVCYTAIGRKVYKSCKASGSSSEATSHRSKAKVFVVAAVFFICFAPLNFVFVPYTLIYETGNTDIDCKVENAIDIAKEITLWLSATSVCLDKLIYIFLCKIFRRQLVATLSCKTIPQGTMGAASSTQQEMSPCVTENPSIPAMSDRCPLQKMP